MRCDDIPAAVKCASVSRWACRKRRAIVSDIAKNSGICQTHQTIAQTVSAHVCVFITAHDCKFQTSRKKCDLFSAPEITLLSPFKLGAKIRVWESIMPSSGCAKIFSNFDHEQRVTRPTFIGQRDLHVFYNRGKTTTENFFENPRTTNSTKSSEAALEGMG